MNLDTIVERTLENRFKKIVSGRLGLTILIEPVSRCNLACKYCAATGYEHDKPFKVMPKKILDNFLELLGDFILKYSTSEAPVRASILLHGYEPLQAGREFFAYVQDKIKELGYYRNVRFGVQTNGVLVDEEWANFFKERGWNVGFSLDGPKEYHDANRVFVNGRGSYDLAIRGYRLVRERMKRIGVISVITKAHTKPTIDDAVERYYQWLLDEKIRGIVIHYASYSKNNPNYKTYAMSDDEIIEFFTKLYDYWKDRDDGIEIVTFGKIIESMIKGRARWGACNQRNGCWRIIGIDYQGIVHLCDRWSYVLGPISKYNKFEQILFDKVMKLQAMRPIVLKKYDSNCSTCKYFNICQGGCANEAMYHTENSGFSYFGVPQWNRTQFCRVNKAIFAHIEKDLRSRGIPLRI